MGGPPPPPGGFAPPAFYAPPQKPLNLSSKPLKSFNWTKIPPMKVKETVWGELDDAGVHEKLRSVGEYGEFEELFAAKEVRNLKDGAMGASTESLASKEITFLDPKRSQNCNIMLKAIKLSAPTITTALATVDDTILTSSVLVELLKFLPTDEDRQAISQYPPGSPEYENLASAERFLSDVSRVEKYEGKLRGVYTKVMFGEWEDDARGLVERLEGASKDVGESGKFKEVLKIILALGNYMNAGQRGGAFGFKLGSILKMMDTKSTVQGRKHTLLHYLTELIEKRFPELADFTTELKNVEEGAKVTIPQIRTVMIQIRDNLKELKILIDDLEKDKGKSAPKKVIKPTDGPSTPGTSEPVTKESPTTEEDRFIPIMKSFHNMATEKYEDLDKKFKESEKEYESVVNLYGEDVKTTTPEEFFGIFAKFVGGYQLAKTENEMAVKKAEDEKKKEEQRLIREEKKRAAKAKGGVKRSGSGE
ncbi:hypothetical protein HK097_005992, partial [Rhizophlyctis rosea]